MEANKVIHDYSAQRVETPTRSSQANIAVNRNAAQIIRLHGQSAWSRMISNRLDDLNNLEAGWDSYDAVPVRFSTAKFVSEMLEELYFSSLPVPNILPTKSGGLQIEWHRGCDSIEIAVNKPNVASCYVCIEADDVDEEFQARSDYVVIRRHLIRFLGH